MKRILINSSYGDELRVALVDGAKLYDFDTESPEKILLKGRLKKNISINKPIYKDDPKKLKSSISNIKELSAVDLDFSNSPCK